VIVLDASAAIDWLVQTGPGRRIEKRIYVRSESLHAPPVLAREVAQVLRRLASEGAVTARRGNEAIRDVLDLRPTRYPRIVPPHLAITRDSRLAAAPGHAATMEAF